MEPPQNGPNQPQFAAVAERNTADNLLRTAQQHHVQLSMMADVKANIIITVSSIVITLCLGRLSDPGLRVSAVLLLVFTLLALLLAILAVLPKYRPLRYLGADLPQHFNILFFGHFGALDRERFFAELAKRMGESGGPYQTMACDLYELGSYLARYKYPFLRWSYLFFLTGFLLAGAEQIRRLLAGLIGGAG